MPRRTHSQKTIAATLLLLMLTNVFAPTVSYALTAGPTAPEVTSFEPVDTTDLVNLQTGDFTYNIPLLEVPGPDGGYPLALSYHAGIQPNVEASWVGLGWTLNPGAINRSVNGEPDDWHAVTNNRQDYYEGGTTKSYSAGITIGWGALPVNASVGLTFANDTYDGFGLEGFQTGLDVGYSYDLKGIGKVGARVGISNTQGAHGSLGLTNSKVGVWGELGVATNFKTVDGSVSGGIGFLEASLSTSGDRTVSIAGLNTSPSVRTSQDAPIQTEVKSYGMNIPTPWYFSVSLGYSKMRYWIDRNESISAYGSLYLNDGPEDVNNISYDSYSLLEDNLTAFIRQPDATKHQGGSFPEFDNYNVLAQGISGSIRPYYFQGSLLDMNRLTESGGRSVRFMRTMPTTYNPKFRFEGDFSNTYQQNYPMYGSSIQYNITTGSQPPPFDPNPVFGEPGNPSAGYSPTNGLAASRTVSVNQFIKPSKAAGYDRNARYRSSMIEGFSVTNASGVTYHYALPAYCWGEEITQHKLDESRGVFLNRSSKPGSYAYSWYLTTITGPDFVDRNGNNIADDQDWGYWVNFEYGKWSNNYSWRNPAEGAHKDEDEQWENCSMGKKEVYFLNSIRTRSHVALFEKSIRNDGKSSSPEIFEQFGGTGNNKYKYKNEGVFNFNSTQNLKLDRIYLLNASDAQVVNEASAANNPYYVAQRNNSLYTECELPQNVLDKSDVDAAGRQTIEDKSIRVIDFKYDYSLCKRTANSFDAISGSSVKTGKLTLNKLSFLGKGGHSVLPATSFEYDLPLKIVKGSVINGAYEPQPKVPELGDILVTNDATEQYAGVVVRLEPQPQGNYKYILKGGEVAIDDNKTYKVTKNPPYNKSFYDNWGMFRGYFDPSLGYKNENLARMVDPAAAKCADAWSLRKISTPQGGNISVSYEPDDYGATAFDNSPSFILSNLSDFSFDNNNNQYGSFYCTVQSEGYNLKDFIKEGDRVRFSILTRERQESGGSVVDIPSSDILEGTITGLNFATGTFRMTNVDRQLFVLRSSTVKYIKLVTGNLYTSQNKVKYGGGLRVAKISVGDNSGSIAETKYAYRETGDVMKSSGVTSYEPTIFPIGDWAQINAVTYPRPWGADEDHEKVAYFEQIKQVYKERLYRNIDRLYLIARELPSPGVMYQYVTVTNSVKDNATNTERIVPSKRVYQFEVPRENMVDRQVAAVQESNISVQEDYHLFGDHDPHTFHQRAANIVIKKFTSAIGNLKRVIDYDNTGKKLSETINHYLHDGLENLPASTIFDQYKSRLSNFKYQGYLQERNSQVKMVYTPGYRTDVLSTLSGREDYPCISTGTTVINYVNGTKTVQQNLGFDFYSGAVTKTLSIDADGNRFMDSTTPAYRIYPEMGVKASNSANKNMLTQVAANYSFIVNASNNVLGLKAASINTWSNSANVLDPNYTVLQQNGGANGNVWRPRMTYTWAPEGQSQNGATAIGLFVGFNWSSQDDPQTQNTGWIKTGQVTLYDVFSHALEASDINSQFAATKMGYNHSKVMINGGPARYAELAYSGAEDNPVNSKFNGDINMGSAIQETAPVYVHTGSKSVKLNSGQTGFSYTVPIGSNGPSSTEIDPARDYFASVWIKSGNGTLVSNAGLYYSKGGTPVYGTVSSANPAGWQLATLKIPAAALNGGGTLTVGCYNNENGNIIYLDDLRFHPLNAGVNSYVYDNFTGELAYILDDNNFFTKFEYDDAGRLIKTYRETMVNGSRPVSEFQYHYPQFLYKNDAIVNESFTKNDCQGTNVTGSSILINIPEGQFTSSNSKEEANLQARAYAQQQANQQGTCNGVYVRIEYEEYYDLGGYDEYMTSAYPYIRAYKDAACTIPYTGSVTVSYRAQSQTSVYTSGDATRCTDRRANPQVITVTFNKAFLIGGGVKELISYTLYNPETSEAICNTSTYFEIVN
ncbi:DUF5977 domain-containing protein [Niabella sp. CC-SYL272]|uniref:DUF5977 domain-containing protein n=1 Tax=Niabella agricola TaxID=2891571 RepID=UPI001F1D3F23|nr:DUF5977 domain-containing protein [Niabella agricola]MCF3107873.1 DUF5977 domain-containing protein [Niabella agricola]